MKVFFDGGFQPGGMETAVVLRGEAFVRTDLGPGSSIEAEWLALIDALQIARDRAIDDILLLGDCLTVIDRANGKASCRGHDSLLYEQFQSLVDADRPPRVRYIRRTQNLAGIALARLHDR